MRNFETFETTIAYYGYLDRSAVCIFVCWRRKEERDKMYVGVHLSLW